MMLIKKIKHLSLIVLISLILTVLPPVLATPLFVNYVQTENLIEQSKKFYEIGRVEEAVELLKQAIAKYQANGDKLNQAITLSNLSLAYQKLGQWQKAEKTINNSLNLLEFLSKNNQVYQIYAQSLDVKGNLQFAQGEFENAIKNWQDAYLIYSRLNLQPALIQSRINQAQAMQALGLFIQAQNTLNSVQESLEQQPDSILKSVGLRSLADVLRMVGNLNESKQILQQKLDDCIFHKSKSRNQ
ncbi:MAG: tetratricopeptide repeat protein [Nostocaceae cyanobacterium CSU_2_110]|nr:tetratricopeptide repeat protein [Nostocaceae cyanobacterium CSU_2_110]